MKTKLPKLSTIRNKCDDLLTPIVMKLYPTCLLCGKSTEVAHHHVHKSKSTRLRYDFDNLINLCCSCHFKLHQNESYWASQIVKIKGLDWFNKIDKRGTEVVKADVHYFMRQHAILEEIMRQIS